MISSEAEAEAVARTARRREGAVGLALFIWAIVVGLVSHLVIAPQLYLIYHYGWARVRREGLSIVGWESRREKMIVSNGDRLTVWEYEHDMFTLPVWAAIMAVTVGLMWLLWRLWRRLTKDDRTTVAGDG